MEETLLNYATAMVCVQSMERCLIQVLTFVLPGKKALSKPEAEEFVANLNKRTLGQLHGILGSGPIDLASAA